MKSHLITLRWMLPNLVTPWCMLSNSLTSCQISWRTPRNMLPHLVSHDAYYPFSFLNDTCCHYLLTLRYIHPYFVTPRCVMINSCLRDTCCHIALLLRYNTIMLSVSLPSRNMLTMHLIISTAAHFEFWRTFLVAWTKRFIRNYITPVSCIIIYIRHKHPSVNPHAKLLGFIWTPKIQNVIISARSSEGKMCWLEQFFCLLNMFIYLFYILRWPAQK